VLSPLNWLALSTEFGLLPFREGPSAWLTEADPGRSTSRAIRSSSSALLSERLGTGDTTFADGMSEASFLFHVRDQDSYL
jgi:hypothetical protein